MKVNEQAFGGDPETSNPILSMETVEDDGQSYLQISCPGLNFENGLNYGGDDADLNGTGAAQLVKSNSSVSHLETGRYDNTYQRVAPLSSQKKPFSEFP